MSEDSSCHGNTWMLFHLHAEPDFRLKEGDPSVDVTPDTTYILHFPFEELGINFCLFRFACFYRSLGTLNARQKI